MHVKVIMRRNQFTYLETCGQVNSSLCANVLPERPRLCFKALLLLTKTLILIWNSSPGLISQSKAVLGISHCATVPSGHESLMITFAAISTSNFSNRFWFANLHMMTKD